MPELAVSTWSLHRELGPMYREPATPGGEREPDYAYGKGELTLLELPARLTDFQVTNLEICHFHFPRTDAAYLAELKHRLEVAGVKLLTILIDSGDITATDLKRRQQDLEWIRGWIDVAAQLEAQRVRVIAGHAQPDPEGKAVQASIDGLSSLAAYARERGVEVITENWFAITMRPENLLSVLDGAGGSVGLCADFGNYGGPTKYQDLEAILPRATSIHAKAEFPEAGTMNREDFTRCLDLSRQAGFRGQYVLIFDGPGDEWGSLTQIADAVAPYL